jgi:hypothetical protein
MKIQATNNAVESIKQRCEQAGAGEVCFRLTHANFIV